MVFKDGSLQITRLIMVAGSLRVDVIYFVYFYFFLILEFYFFFTTDCFVCICLFVCLLFTFRSKLFWVKKCVEMFLRNKSLLNTRHQFALVLLQENTCFWVSCLLKTAFWEQISRNSFVVLQVCVLLGRDADKVIKKIALLILARK